MLAAKNFKRNRKRYRSTVVGLFLSVTLFISASSFCAYLTDAVDQLGGDSTLGVQLYYSEALPEGVTPEQRLGQLAAADGVESGFYTADSYASLHFAKEDMDPDYWKDTGLEETAAPSCTSSGMRISGSCCGTTACRRRITSVPMHLRRWRGICWTSGAAPRAVSTISCTITIC